MAAVMSGRGVWLRARARLRRFPALLADCGEQVGPGGSTPGGGGGGGDRRAGAPLRFPVVSPQAAAYGRCVAAAAGGTAELRRDACLEEFSALRDCFARAVGPGAAGAGSGPGPAGPRPGLTRGSLQAKATPK